MTMPGIIDIFWHFVPNSILGLFWALPPSLYSIPFYSLLSTVFWAKPKEVVHWMHWYKWRRQLAVLLRRSFELQFVPLRIDPIVLPLKLTTKTTRCNDVQLDTFICWLSTRRCHYVVADMLPLMRCLLTCRCRAPYCCVWHRLFLLQIRRAAGLAPKAVFRISLQRKMQ